MKRDRKSVERRHAKNEAKRLKPAGLVIQRILKRRTQERKRPEGGKDPGRTQYQVEGLTECHDMSGQKVWHDNCNIKGAE